MIVDAVTPGVETGGAAAEAPQRQGLPRSVEIITAAVALLVAAPLLAGVAAGIALTSGRPVLFRQARVGRHGRLFTILKFRTMAVDAAGPGITVQGDSRVTRLGAVLRRLKLDELPALWNVIRGDVALVGPRPEVPGYVEPRSAAWRDVLAVRPGLTDPMTLRLRNEEELLARMAPNQEEFYRTHLQPFKLRGYREYARSRSWVTDVSVLWHSLGIVLSPNAVSVPTVAEIASAAVLAEAGSDDERHRFVRGGLWRRLRHVVIWLLHLGLAGGSSYAAWWLRFDGQVPADDWVLYSETLLGLLAIRGVCFVPFRLYEGLWRYTSVLDLRNILLCVATSSVVFVIWVRWWLGLVEYPRSIFIIDALLLATLAGGIRLLYRLYRDIVPAASGRTVLVYGAGDAGEAIVREMQRDPSHAYTPIGFLDDEPSKVGQRIHGVRVLGRRSDLPRVMAERQPNEVLITIRRAGPDTYQLILRALEPFGARVTTLAGLEKRINGAISTNQIRQLAVEDLLHRAPVGLSTAPLRRLIAGRRVLVTGAGGSVGSELCRQVIGLDPAALILVERHENALFDVMNSLEDQGLSVGTNLHAVLGDVTDRAKVDAVLSTHRPHLVFHAAAHKHVPLMESNACEAVKNNITGTRIVAEASARAGVRACVLISSDKAVSPVSVMGATKRVTELMFQSHPWSDATTCFAVRFGNVLGSNGSVVPRFLQQVARGGPVTVTHPEARRYFMLISEAVQLLLHAAARGESGRIYVLEMGEPIRLLDLAHDVIRLSGYAPGEVPIQFIGLRPGERLDESLVGAGETASASTLEGVLEITQGPVPDPARLARQVATLEAAAVRGDVEAVLAGLSEIVPSLGSASPRGPLESPARQPLALEAQGAPGA